MPVPCSAKRVEARGYRVHMILTVRAMPDSWVIGAGRLCRFLAGGIL
jgi:hypothetical protein